MVLLEILQWVIIGLMLIVMVRRYFPIIVTYKLNDPLAKKPTKAYGKAACFDVYATKSVVIPSNQWREVPLGITFAAWPHIYIKLFNITLTPLGNVAAKIHTRSGHAIRKGLRAHLGIIDNDYRNSWTVNLMNHNQEYPISIKAGERVAQIEWYRVPSVWQFRVKKLGDTHRGDRGFGSSGKF